HKAASHRPRRTGGQCVIQGRVESSTEIFCGRDRLPKSANGREHFRKKFYIKKSRCIREMYAAVRSTGGKGLHSTQADSVCQIDSHSASLYRMIYTSKFFTSSALSS